MQEGTLRFVLLDLPNDVAEMLLLSVIWAREPGGTFCRIRFRRGRG
jgi:hypothetical protein